MTVIVKYWFLFSNVFLSNIMYTFKLSKNQEFLFSKGSNRFLSLLYSFNSDIDINKLRVACEKSITSINLVNYNLVDVSATFPLQSSVTLKAEVDILVDLNFSADQFYKFVSEKKQSINSYSEKNLNVTIIQSKKTFIWINASCVFYDNFSVSQFVNRAICFYKNNDTEFNEEIDYFSYTEWQNEILSEEKSEENFYLQKSNEFPENYGLQLSFGRSLNIINAHVQDVYVYNGKEANRDNLAAATLKFISYYTLQKEFTIGLIPFERNHEILNDTIGLINTPLPVFHSTKLLIRIEEIVANIVETKTNRDNFNYNLVDKKFDEVQFVYFDDCITEHSDNFQVQLEAFLPSNETNSLKILFIQHKNQIIVRLISPYIQSDEFSVLFADQLGAFLKTYIEKGELELVATEKQILFYENNLWPIPVKSNFSVNSRFLYLLEESFNKYCENPCLSFNQKTLSFSEVSKATKCMACYLKEELGIQNGDVVAIALPRGIDQIVAMLSLIKLGACFLPIDPATPDLRRDFICKDANVKEIIDEVTIQSFNNKDKEINFVQLDLNLDDPFYCIYTSGSTGLPKGCCITQRNILNYIRWIEEYWKGKEEGKVGYFTPLTFDFTITSVLGSLLSGSCLSIVDEEVDLSIAINELIEDSHVQFIKLTPAHIGLINEDTLRNAIPKTFILGGEALSKNQVEFLRINKECKIYNEYGPTEATVGCIVHLVDDTNEPLIGRPIPGMNVIVADRNNNLLPVGCVGEILLAGESVIKEYVKSSDRTIGKFIFLRELNRTFYRTGDMARINSKGLYEYLGREDDQIKLNGYRIELNEVEAIIKNIQHIQDATVVVHTQNDNKQLVAFWVSDNETIEFNSELKRMLPSYMIPSRYIKLESLPLNKNGKVDKTFLSKMKIEEEKVVNPLDTKTETLIADVIAFELRIERNKIGKESNFITLGGDSIKAIQVLAKLRKNHFQLSLQDLMGGRTIAYLGRNLKNTKKQTNQNAVIGNVELAPIQSLFFSSSFIAGPDSEKGYFNQSQLIEIIPDVTSEDLNEIMLKIIEHHDMLRVTYLKDSKEQIIQSIQNINSLKVEIVSLDFISVPYSNVFSEIESACESLKRQLNYFDGRIIKMAFIQTIEKNYFFITIHHLIIDLVSWKIILEDIDMLLTQKLMSKKMQLSAKTDSYQTWSSEMKTRTVELFQNEDEFFWNNILSQKVNHIAAENKGYLFNESESIVVPLIGEQVNKIKQIIERNYFLNAQSIVLRSLGDGLACSFGIGSYRVQMESHGRNALGETDLSRTVGWFTSVYPVVLPCYSEHSTVEDFIALGYTLSNLPMSGLSFGMLKMENRLRDESGISWVEFNYLGDLVDNSNVYSNFKLSELSHGFEASRHLKHMADFSVLAYHKSEQLFTEFNYNPKTISKQKMKILASKTAESFDRFLQDFEYKHVPFLSGSQLSTKGISYQIVKKLGSELGGIEDILLLSPLQSGMYFHTLAEESDRSYFWQYAYRIKRHVNAELFKKAFSILLERHQTLRIIFRSDILIKPVQIICKDSKIDFRFFDMSEYQPQDQETRLAAIREEDIKEGFDISNGPLIRLYLIKLSDNEFYRIWSNHHLLLDGWSTQIVLKEFDQIYFDLLAGNTPNLVELPSFSKYIEWYQGMPVSESQKFWRYYLQDYEYSLSLPRDFINPFSRYIPKDYFFSIDPDVTAKLVKYASSIGVTLNALVQCLWGLIIARQNQINDVVFGSVVSGRTSEVLDSEKMVGMFINTIPNRITFDNDASFKSILEVTFKSFINGEHHHYLPLFEIQKQSVIGKDLIQNVITYVNYPSISAIEEKNGWGDSIDPSSVSVFETTQFDINVLVYQGNALEFNIKYNSAAYSNEAMIALSNLWRELFQRILNNDNLDIYTLFALTDEERLECLSGAGVGERIDLGFENVIEVLEDAFSKTPNAICVSDDTRNYTYSEFWSEADSFGKYLQEELHVVSNDLVGILLPRSAEQLIALIGILKTGAAYVPLDISWPKERVSNIVGNGKSKVLVNEDTFLSYKKWLLTKEDLGAPIATNISSESIAYCIYTSGSTGMPKGCAISHKNLVNYLSHANNYWVKNDFLEVPYFTTLSFDFTVTSLFGCWINQGRLLVYHDEENIYDVVNEIVANPNTKVIKLAPAHVNLLEDEILRSASVKTYILGGEALTHSHIKKLKLNSGCKIINEYGPTEVTVGSITHLIEEDEFPFIGKPIINTNVYLLNERLQLVPFGAIGEIYMSGFSVGKGYLGMKDLTETKFLPNPFGEGHLYKTGDLARWTHRKKLHYLGRNDNQVKINGYRVELDDIIITAESHPEVQTFYVLVKKDNQGVSRLFGYFTGNLKESVLFDHITSKLPDYMVPSLLQKVDSFELTTNGKIDKNKLPIPVLEIPIGEDRVMTESENLLKKIWSDVLMIDERIISHTSNFIKLGGDSIKAIRLVVKLRENGVKIILKNILSALDLSSMAKDLQMLHVADESEESYKGPFNLSPIQSMFLRNVFINGELADKNFYNQSRIIRFGKRLEAGKLKEVLLKLISHHDALRLNFKLDNPIEQEFNEVNQDIFFFKEFFPDGSFFDDPITYISNNGSSEVKQKISINDRILLSLGLYQGNTESYVLISIHHLIVDQISWDFLLQDFMSLMENPEMKLPHKTNSYKTYCDFLNGLKNKNVSGDALEYWNRVDKKKEINLRRASIEKRFFLNYESSSIIFTKSESSLIKDLLTGAIDFDIQIFSIQALTNAMVEIFGHGNYRFHIEGHGRDLDEEIDVSRTIGWFTSITPLVVEHFLNSDNLNGIVKLRNEFNKRKKYINYYGPLFYSEQLDSNWSSKSWIEFNFLGDSNLGTSQNASLIFEQTGDESSLNLSNMADFICVGEWRNDILHFRFTYENNLFSNEEIRNLEIRFKDEVIKLVNLLSDVNNSKLLNGLCNLDLIDNGSLELIESQFGDIENVARLTPLQLGMYFLHSSSGDSKAYHWQYGCELVGHLDIKKYKESFSELIHNYGVLKTIIRDDIAAEPLQLQLKSVKVDFRFIDLSLNDPNYKSDFIAKILQEDLHEGFDMSQRSPVRLILVKLDDDLFYRLWSNHHIILDGWSTSIVLNELEEIYSSKLANLKFEQKNQSDFSDYLKWLDANDVSRSRLFWAEYLKGINHVVEITKEKTGVKQFEHKDHQFSLSETTTRELKEFLLQSQVTLNVAVHFLWAIILSKKSNKNDVIFGSIVSGRPTDIPGIDQAVGMFINAIPVRVQLNNELTFLEQLKNFQSSFYESLPHHFVNLGDITSSTTLGSSIINNIITFERESIEYVQRERFQEVPYEIKNEYVFESTNYDLNFIIKPQSRLTFLVKYNYNCYSVEQIEQLTKNWIEVVDSLLYHPQVLVKDVYLSNKLESNIELNAIEKKSEFSFKNSVNSYSDVKKEAGDEFLIDKLIILFADVLECDASLISKENGFFEMGGHSINAIKILSRIRKDYGLKVSYSSFVKSNKITDLAKMLTESVKDVDVPDLIKIDEHGSYDVSPSQRRMWLLNQLENSSNAYNVFWGYKITGSFQIDCFEQAIAKLLERHEILRTIYVEDIHGTLKQLVLNSNNLIFKVSFISHFESTSEKDIFVRNIIEKPFDLKNGPVIRNCVIDCGEYLEWYIVLHHIATDDDTFRILMREIEILYHNALTGNEEVIPMPQFQYKDYSFWINRLNLEGYFVKEIEFWKKKLDGMITSLNIPTELPRPKKYENTGKSEVFAIPPVTITGLRRLAKESNMSLFSVLLTFLKIVLRAYSNQDTITVGTPLSGRVLSQLQDQLGYYLNAVPVLSKIQGDELLGELLNKVNSNISESYSHANISFDDLINELNVERDMSRNPIFDVWADYHIHSKDKGNRVRFQDCLIEDIHGASKNKVTKFDLTFVFIDDEENIDVHFEYNTSIYSHAIAENIISSYLHILSNYHSSSNVKIDHIDCVSVMQSKVIQELFQAKQKFNSPGSLLTLFNRAVKENRNEIAVSTKKSEITYNELDELSNAFADFLKKKKGTQQGQWVAISLPRNEMVLVAIFGIIKIGAAYVPMELDLVEERKKFILNDLQIDLIVDEDVIEEFQLMRNLFSTSYFDVQIKNSDFVYCMYTSGSTGTPKSVKITHHNLYSSNIARQLYYGNQGLRSFALYSYSFDSSVNLFFDTLLTGGNLYLYDTPKLDLFQVWTELNINKSEILTIPPSLYDLLMEYGSCPYLKKVIVAGEECLSSVVRKHFEINSFVELYNEYGPTECTVWSLVNHITENNEKRRRVPIGLPIPFASIQILNENKRKVPPGAFGELYISGPGVAPDYTGNFVQEDDELFGLKDYYKTGDLVRLNSDFQIEYISRVDNQIKIRGFRVEAGEVENSIKSVHGVSSVYVTHFKDADQQNLLVAYFTGDISSSELIILLRQKMQDYMVPSFIKKIDFIPLTLNGKVDEVHLPKDFSELIEKGSEAIQENTFDSEIRDMWSEATGLDRDLIFYDSDFFGLGGNSLKAIKLINILGKKFGFQIHLNILFTHTQFRDFVQAFELLRKSKEDIAGGFYLEI